MEVTFVTVEITFCVIAIFILFVRLVVISPQGLPEFTCAIEDIHELKTPLLKSLALKELTLP
jgi:hypothetical protein